jgi:hypothetical protein
MRSSARLMRMRSVLAAMDYEPVLLGPNLVTPRVVESLQTQYGSDDPEYNGYGYVARPILTRARKGDIIIATEQWHCDYVFRGVLEAGDGRWNGIPVIELWIDYKNPMCRFRVFASEYHRMRTCIWQEREEWTEDWIVGYPAYPPAESVEESEIFDAEKRQKHDLHHLEAMRQGIPVLAPNWGIWRETVEHGVTGVLYQSAVGKPAAEDFAYKLPSATVSKYTCERFSVEEAVAAIKPFFHRASNG